MSFHLQSIDAHISTEISELASLGPTLTGHQIGIRVKFSPPRQAPMDPDRQVRRIQFISLEGQMRMNNRILAEVRVPELGDEHRLSYDWSLQFQSILFPEMIEKMEEIRAGKELSFNLRFWGLVQSGVTIVKIRDEISFTIAQSEWVKVLAQLGRWQHALIEVPVPPSPPKGSVDMTYAFNQIQEAQRHFLAGDYRDAVADCREVFEKIKDFLGDASTPNPPLYGDLKTMSALTKAERLRLLRTASMIYTHPAHHAGKIPPFGTPPGQFSRMEAYNMIAITGALYSMVVQEIP